MDRHSKEYLELAEQRHLLKSFGEKDYKEFKWAEDFLQKIGKQGFTYYQDFYDLKRAREIGLSLKAKYGNNSDKQKHITSHYIWHTQEDGKVRSSHAANDGEIFAWENPPATKNPGEDYGCRCWAEPYNPEFKEDRIQNILFIKGDDRTPWTREELFDYYKNGKGETVSLHEIGHLQNIINCATTLSQKGGGTLFERVSWDICRKARQAKGGSFLYSFRNSYEFEPYVFEIGGATVGGNSEVHVIEKEGYLIISANIYYNFSDLFNNPYDYFDKFPIPYDPKNKYPFMITEDWKMSLEAIIKKDSSKSKYPDDEFQEAN